MQYTTLANLRYIGEALPGATRVGVRGYTTSFAERHVRQVSGRRESAWKATNIAILTHHGRLKNLGTGRAVHGGTAAAVPSRRRSWRRAELRNYARDVCSSPALACEAHHHSENILTLKYKSKNCSSNMVE
jgi:hypothetical protein